MTHQSENNNIENVLQNINPQPGERFYQKMQNAPWTETRPMNSTQSARFPRAGLVGIAAALIVMTMIVFTPLGTLAQEAISQFFNQLASNNQSSTITVDIEPTAVSETIYVTPQSVPEVQSEVDFQIGLPAELRGFIFSDATTYEFDGVHQVALFYIMPGDTTQGRNLVIKQSSASDDLSPSEVGANAIIEQVQIRDVLGEYTRGYWRLAEDPTVIAQQGTEHTLEISQVWDNSIGFQFLRWEADGVRYEIMFQESYNAMLPNYESDPTVPGLLGRDDLIAIAASIR